jgi:hypothetical protein
MGSIVGLAKRGWGKALGKIKSAQRARRIATGERGATITGVKPFSGKIPSYVRGTAKERADSVRTHAYVKRIDKVNEAKTQIKEGKEKLKSMEATRQAEQRTDYKGRKTGDYRAIEIKPKD